MWIGAVGRRGAFFCFHWKGRLIAPPRSGPQNLVGQRIGHHFITVHALPLTMERINIAS